MRTRTLLLLAVSCGLIILVAGGIQLLRLANQDRPAAPLQIGDRGAAGDAVVVVESVATQPDSLTVTVELSGVDDADGLDGFSLIAPNVRLAHDAQQSTCAVFTVAPVTCTLVFPADRLTGSDRQLLFRRAEQQVRWILV